MTGAASRLLSRRAVLRLAILSALATITGCRGDNPSSTSGSAASSRTATKSAASSMPGEDPAVQAVVERAGEAERALLAAYDDAIAVRPELTTLLAPLRADHATHVKSLLGGGTDPAHLARSTSSPPSLASSPAAAADLLAQLAALEKAAANATLSDMPAGSSSLSRLIASIGACEASHGAVLDAARSGMASPPTPSAQRSAT